MMGYRTFAGRGPLRTALMIAAFAASGTAVAACGSDDGGSASKDDGAATAAESSGVQQVTALANELLKRPTSISITKPIGKPVPEGKEVVWISCGVPACVTLGETFTEGAKELGWKTRVINTDGTPEKIKAAWSQAASSKPDGVASSGTDLSVVAPQLKQLEEADIPVALYAVPEKTNGVDVLVGDMQGEAESYGEPMAAWIVKDSGGDANTLLVTLPSFPILAGLKQGFDSTYKQGCADCGMKTLDLPLSALGKDVPARIVSTLRANPNIDYVAMAVDDLTVGLPAALRAAGLADKVKIIGATTGQTNIQYIKAGQQAAGVPNAWYDDTWQLVDGLARIFVGEDPSVSEATPPRMILVQDNLPDNTDVFPLVPDFREQFLKLWGKNA